jgi:hypothetical protein
MHRIMKCTKRTECFMIQSNIWSAHVSSIRSSKREKVRFPEQRVAWNSKLCFRHKHNRRMSYYCYIYIFSCHVHSLFYSATNRKIAFCNGIHFTDGIPDGFVFRFCPYIPLKTHSVNARDIAWDQRSVHKKEKWWTSLFIRWSFIRI